MYQIPEIKAYDTGKHFVVWCRFCLRYHYHSRVSGHAFCHCFDSRPDHRYALGYLLVFAGPAPHNMLRDLKRRRPHGPPWCF
jgi:hypothetical protein